MNTIQDLDYASDGPYILTQSKSKGPVSTAWVLICSAQRIPLEDCYSYYAQFKENAWNKLSGEKQLRQELRSTQQLHSHKGLLDNELMKPHPDKDEVEHISKIKTRILDKLKMTEPPRHKRSAHHDAVASLMISQRDVDEEDAHYNSKQTKNMVAMAELSEFVTCWLK